MLDNRRDRADHPARGQPEHDRKRARRVRPYPEVLLPPDEHARQARGLQHRGERRNRSIAIATRPNSSLFRYLPRTTGGVIVVSPLVATESRRHPQHAVHVVAIVSEGDDDAGEEDAGSVVAGPLEMTPPTSAMGRRSCRRTLVGRRVLLARQRLEAGRQDWLRARPMQILPKRRGQRDAQLEDIADQPDQADRRDLRDICQLRVLGPTRTQRPRPPRPRRGGRAPHARHRAHAPDRRSRPRAAWSPPRSRATHIRSNRSPARTTRRSRRARAGARESP